MVFREKLPLQDKLALTFDDVILLPGVTEVDPVEVNLRTKVSRTIDLNIPVVSSPMDTVTESRMAIQLARLGGIGIIHRNMSIEQQFEEVLRVKEAEPYKITYIFVRKSSTVREALQILKQNNIDSAPVVDESGRVLGIIRRCDLLMLSPLDTIDKASIRSVKPLDVKASLSDLKRFMIENQVDIAVLAYPDGRLAGTVTIWDIEYEKPFTPVLDGEGRLRVGAAISPFDLERIRKLEKYVDVLVTDIAHFANRKAIEATKKIEKEVSCDLVVGNLGTYECTVEVITSLEKIDGVRAGIASGSICTTGEVTGVAAPTLWAVAQVADALLDHGLNQVPVIADGGIRTGGDAVKAFAVGAWCVMLGRVLAATDESPSPIITIGNKKYKYYRGMASEGARQRRFAVDRYGRKVKDIAEGVEGLVPYRGPLEQVLREFISAIQAAMGYIGAKNIPECWTKAKLRLVTPVGKKEIEPHSILLDLPE